MIGPHASGGGINPTDVAALLHELSRTSPDVIKAVAAMVHAATQGRSLNIDVRHLGIDARLIARVLEAAGGSRQGGSPHSMLAGLLARSR